MRRCSVRGFTLIELVVSITIVGIVSSTIVGLMSVIAQRSATVLMKQQVAEIANSYIQEALSKPFASQPGARNDVADYNFIDNGARDQMGNALAGLGGYRVQISAQPALLAGVVARRVVVTVTDPGGGSTSVSGYKLSP